MMIPNVKFTELFGISFTASSLFFFFRTALIPSRLLEISFENDIYFKVAYVYPVHAR